MTEQFVVSTDFQGLLFQPRDRVAMTRQELAGRLEVLSDDGTLSHRPGPLELVEGPPFVRVSTDALVNPVHAWSEPEVLVLPGGWRVAGHLPAATAPAAGPAPDPTLIGGVRASEVLYCQGGGRYPAEWVTDRGRVVVPGIKSGRILAAHHPRLLQVTQSCHANPRRLRRLTRVLGGANRCLLHFDEGTTLTLNMPAALKLARELGAAEYDWIGTETDVQRELRVLGLQRWPFSLLDATPEFLVQEFPGQPARLLCNLALATVEAHRRGEPVPDGHRGWYYTVARRALEGAGHLVPGLQFEVPGDPSTAPVPPKRRNRSGEYRTFGYRPPLDAEAAWLLVCIVWPHLVGSLRLFTYGDAGFQDQKPEARRMGDRHPDIVLLVEKDALRERAFALGDRFGITVYVTGGTPPLIGSEQLARALKSRGCTSALILSYCDFDVVGWDLPVMLAGHLDRYEVATSEIRRLVTPDRFTPDELERLSVPLPSKGGRNWRSRVDRFMAESGGIGGRRRGIGAEHLFPMSRLVNAFPETIQDWLAPEAPA